MFCLRIEIFISYSGYSKYRMKITTVQLNEETKQKIASFGSKNETYDEILNRIYNAAVKVQLREFLTSGEAISLEDFKKEVEKEWPKSK